MSDEPSFNPQDFKIQICNFGFKPSELKWNLREKNKSIHIIDKEDNEYILDFLSYKHAKWFADEKLKIYTEEEQLNRE